MQCTLFATILLSLASFAAAQPAAQPITIQPVGVAVLDPAAVEGFGPNTPGLGEAGTTVVLQLRSSAEGAGIVDVESHESTLAAFTDDKSKDLSKPPPAPAKKDDNDFSFRREGSQVGPFPAISDDGKTALVTLTAPAAPGVGATKVSVKGTLKVVVAAGKEPVEIKGAPLAKGPVPVPGHKVHIDSVEESQNFEGKSVFKVSLRVEGETANRFESAEFLDAAGKSLGAQKRGSMGGMGTYIYEYELPKKADTATIRISLWKDLKTLDVPLDVTASLGVAK
jgi:hypothetical protein